MKIARKRDVYWVALFILFLCLIAYWGAYQYIGGTYGQSLHNLSNTLQHFISQNDGAFPASEAELIEKGYIIKKNGKIECKYFFFSHYDPKTQISKLVSCPHYDYFTIKYGASLEDVKQGMVLLDGPYSIFVKYRKHNNRLYKKMKAFKDGQSE